jgi:hypothetical protein
MTDLLLISTEKLREVAGKWKRIRITLFLIAFLALSLAGCGGGSNGSSSNTSDDTALINALFDEAQTAITKLDNVETIAFERWTLNLYGTKSVGASFDSSYFWNEQGTSYGNRACRDFYSVAFSE